MEQRWCFGMSLGLLLLGAFAGMSEQQGCGTEHFPRREQFLLNEPIDYQLPNGTEYIGYLVIAPQLKFNCHGSITSWHALTNFNIVDSALDHLPQDITFQLWRPSAEDNKVYSFVGSNFARFIGNEIRERRTILDDGTLFFNLTSNVPTEERLQFQPGDVIGWYIHTSLQSSNQPLTVVYRHATSKESAVDMFSTEIEDTRFAATPPPCDVAICSGQTTLIPSVIPCVTVEYETVCNPTETGPPLCMAAFQNGDCPYPIGSSGVLNTISTGASVFSTATVAFLCPSRTLIATTHPTPPPPNPTTGREETPPTTNQQTQEPVDPLTTSDGPATDSEGITGTELKVPTTSETATDLPNILIPSESTDVGLIIIIGSVTAGIVVIILTLIIVMIAIAVLLKKHVTTEGYLVNNAGAVPTTSNQAYGLTRHGDGKSKVEENIYSYPEVNIATIGAKQNEAYGTHTDIITTEVNQAYGSANITTEINSAYGQIIDSETANDYHSVITQ